MVSFEAAETRRPLIGQLLWFLFWCGVTGFGIYLTPSVHGHGTHTQLGLPPCPSVMYFGRPCPGCGLTTSFTATIHGQFGAAFAAHPLGPLLYALFTLSAFACFYGWAKQQRFDTTSKTFNRTLGGIVLVFFAFGFARFALMPHYGDSDPYHQAIVQAHSVAKR